MRAEIVRSDCLIDAFVSDGVLHVLKSILVTDTHRLHHPITEFIGKHCTKHIGVLLLEDDEWVHGSYTHEMRRVYDSCPGSDDHDCVRVGELVG